jgi:hypothetical protein
MVVVSAEVTTCCMRGGFLLAGEMSTVAGDGTSTVSDCLFYATLTGIDLLARHPDKPLGGVQTEQGQSSVERFADDDDTPPATVTEIIEDYRHNGVNGTIFVGNPAQIADQVKEFIAAPARMKSPSSPISYRTPTTNSSTSYGLSFERAV